MEQVLTNDVNFLGNLVFDRNRDRYLVVEIDWQNSDRTLRNIATPSRVGQCPPQTLHFKLLRNPLHCLLHIFPTIKSRNAEVAFACRPKTRTGRSHDIHRLQQLIKEIPTR